GDERTQAEAASQLMGYQFEIQNAELQAEQSNVDRITANMSLTIAQTGVAPFYYPAYAKLITKDGSFSIPSTVDLSALLPGEVLAVDFYLEDAPIDILQQKFLIEIQSDILLDGQKIMMPTVTQSTEISEITSIFWDIQCPYENTSILVGTSMFDSRTGIDCYCALDSHLYTKFGEQCAVPQ
ncbi:MAG: hypothetical protein CL916_11160, partial [Deltaproteobacteria bacterium]|nr:hypothetical protein [Deltaproteobacteria bacterium]